MEVISDGIFDFADKFLVTAKHRLLYEVLIVAKGASHLVETPFII